jgi:hypothetical protein
MKAANGWKRLTPHVIDELPESAAVFEVANLVRTVQFIGSAQGNLRSRLAEFAQPRAELPAVPGGYYFRYEPAAQEDEALASRIASYRDSHSGKLPARNQGQTRSARVSPIRVAAA